MEEWLTYNDIALVPQYNNVKSRTIPNLETWLTKDIKVDLPFIPANMDTVMGLDLAKIMVANGCIPFLHRFESYEAQLHKVKELQGKCFISCGLKEEQISDAIKLLDVGAMGVVLDVAHGHSIDMIETIRYFKQQRSEKSVIAGNVCTPMAYQDLVNAKADGIKINVGTGSICSTRIVTGFGLPSFTAIQKCGEISKKLRVPIIADGGIVYPKDIALAIAAGANSVMMGKLFASTYESASPKKTLEDGTIVCTYRGQASKEFQVDYYGQLKKGTVPEGVQQEIVCSRSVQELLDSLSGGLKSAMTYGGSTNIKEFQRKAEFVKVTNNYMVEALPRGDKQYSFF